MIIYNNQLNNVGDRFRDEIYDGALFFQSNLTSHESMCDFAIECLEDGFKDCNDISNAHECYEIEEFVDVAKKIKGRFTNSTEVMEHIKSFIEEIGQAPQDYIFHQPRIRIIPEYEYLHAGISYAYKAHRDTWYGGVNSQINLWMPILPIEPNQTMWIAPDYFSKPVQNSSADYSVASWVKNDRFTAHKNIKVDTRPHPLPQEEIDIDSSLKVAGNKADTMVFSGAQLHGSIPNTTQRMRYSIDYRLVHLPDLKNNKGALNVDNGCTDVSESLNEFFHADTFDKYSS